MTQQTTSQTRARRSRQFAENVRRADRADRGVLAYQIAIGTDRDDAITDLLCDLMHLCDTERSSFDEQLSMARDHYAAELHGDQAAFARLRQNGGADSPPTQRVLSAYGRDARGMNNFAKKSRSGLRRG